MQSVTTRANSKQILPYRPPPQLTWNFIGVKLLLTGNTFCICVILSLLHQFGCFLLQGMNNQQQAFTSFILLHSLLDCMSQLLMCMPASDTTPVFVQSIGPMAVPCLGEELSDMFSPLHIYVDQRSQAWTMTAMVHCISRCELEVEQKLINFCQKRPVPVSYQARSGSPMLRSRCTCLLRIALALAVHSLDSHVAG